MTDPLLEFEDVSLGFATGSGVTRVVENADLRIGRGEAVGLVGESGSGKSVLAMSSLGLLPSNARMLSGRIMFEGRDLTKLSDRELLGIRGSRISFIFQEPMTALNPVFTIGQQLVDPMRIQGRMSEAKARDRAAHLLDRMGIPSARNRLNDYPHQLSGGLRQRVMIAMALANSPDLVIADEPTTALDVTTQAEILDLLRELRDELKISILMITHDLGVIAEIASRVYVMYAGRMVESALVGELFDRPRHPYTRGLIDSMPQLGHRSSRLLSIPGAIPLPGRMPPGCRFAPRCSLAVADCMSAAPGMTERSEGHATACFQDNE